jgi:hypothetical protein
MYKAKLEKYWSLISGIPLANFNKTIILTSEYIKFKPSHNGTFKIRSQSKEAFKKLDKMIISILK